MAAVHFLKLKVLRDLCSPCQTWGEKFCESRRSSAIVQDIPAEPKVPLKNVIPAPLFTSWSDISIGNDYDDGSAEVKENVKVSHHPVPATSQLANLGNVDKRLLLPLLDQYEQRPPLVQAVGEESVHYVLLTDAPAKPQNVK